MNFRHFFTLAALACAMLIPNAFAAPADDAAFLAAHGFPADKFGLLAQWDEAAPNAQGHFITGYSLQPVRTQARIDVYRDGDRLLPDLERQQLGIQSKQWTPSAANAPAQHVDFTPKSLAPAIHPYGGATQDYEVLALPPYAATKSPLSNAAGPQPKPSNQIGDFREFLAPITVSGKITSLGTWTSQPNGAWLWQAGVLSPGATGQRLHLAAFSLPDGARITVYIPARIDEAFAQTGAGSDVWMPTVFNEQAAIEIYAPNTAARDACTLTLDKTIHIYVQPETLQKSAGICNLDVTCYPDWADTALGICGIGVVTTDGAIFCTATLIASADTCIPAQPYVLTAHHCVNGQAGADGASNIEFYWFYQTPTCNGTPPDLATVPRTTGGADYLAGAAGTGLSGGGNDFTLLRMHSAPPPTATYVGWTAAVPPVGTEETVVHHPRADYKRISFGTLTDTTDHDGTHFLESTWHNGTTEPGSSGSPLMITATHQIIGQLWGGEASCVMPTSPDYFGRFSLTYPIVQNYIGPNLCHFSAAEYDVSEGDPQAHIGVQLAHATGASGVDVTYTATAGTAVPGQDFTPVTGTLHFTSASGTLFFNVPLLEDFHVDNGRTIHLALSNPTCAELSPSLGEATIVIADDDLDTDGDGISDYDEIHGTYGPPTDPLAADTDRDGLTDHEELFGTYGYTTDPTNPDTDGDGISDFFEIITNTDPTVADPQGLDSLSIPWFR